MGFSLWEEHVWLDLHARIGVLVLGHGKPGDWFVQGSEFGIQMGVDFGFGIWVVHVFGIGSGVS